MMELDLIVEQIRRKKSALCVGLDTDINKIPEFLKKEKYPLFEFNKRIIDSVHNFCVSVKPNIAFYESMGASGWKELELTVDYIKTKYPELFLIADAKRGDIGNTSKLYARAFFEQMNFDAVTVAPYMGEDSVKPFLEFDGKYVILLGLTSNSGSNDFQSIINQENSKPLYINVLEKAKTWGSPNNMMFVIGATKAEMFKQIRSVVKDYFLLVPGVGAQGGDLDKVMETGINSNVGLLINASRSIIFASANSDFEEAAYKEAQRLQKEMSKYL